ncbi:MAG TPA: hypothetical protein VNJ12_06600 [Candidatus Dormibacteraeota bacterium]|nr:hypothetical protein [Candidatus Dormibacteraeota bacterium]
MHTKHAGFGRKLGMDCDWVFLNRDQSVQRVTLPEQVIPECGDGKSHAGSGYEVVFVGTKLVSQKNPVVLAVEHAQNS